MPVDVVDLFAGPGGWDHGLTLLDYPGTVVGVEWDQDACATAAAAGHLRLRADVATYPPSAFAGVDGIIASPPCPWASRAGRGSVTDRREILLEHVARCRDGWVEPAGVLVDDDVRADLTLQPLRWAAALEPRWIACEQVPDVAPLWAGIADVLEAWGYSTWVARLVAANYGVPQTRTRAFLVARRDGVPAVPPEPTHAEYGPTLLGEDPWVSMAEALGVDPAQVAGMLGSTRSQPEDRTRLRTVDRPALTVAFGHDAPVFVLELVADLLDHPDPRRNGTWILDRPATTIQTSGDVARPGHRPPFSTGAHQMDGGSWRISTEAAAVLQGFPVDYPWHGSKTSRRRQIGNAVPPPLAAAVLADLVR